MTRPGTTRRVLPVGALLLGLAACSADRTPKLLSVGTRQPAGTVTRIFVDPASLRIIGHEARVRYTVRVQTTDHREGYPGQAQRIEGSIAFDCQARTFRQLGEETFGFDGRRQPPDPVAVSSGAIEPGSDSALVLDYACASPLKRWWTTYPVVSSRG